MLLRCLSCWKTSASFCFHRNRIIVNNNEAWRFTPGHISSLKRWYCNKKRQCFVSFWFSFVLIKSSFWLKYVYWKIVNQWNWANLTLSLISSITMRLTTTPRYTGVNARLCHSQTVQPHPPSPLSKATAMLYNVRLLLSFVPALDMDLDLLVKPAASTKRWPRVYACNYTCLKLPFHFFPSWLFIIIYLSFTSTQSKPLIT